MNECVPTERPAAKMPWDWFLMALLCLALCILQFRNAGMKRREMDVIRASHESVSMELKNSMIRYDSMFQFLTQFSELARTNADSALIIRKYGIVLNASSNAPAPAASH